MAGTEVAARLEASRRAAGRSRWRDALEGLSDLDRRAPLGAAELELLATAAYLCGDAAAAHAARLRAYQVYVAEGETRRAVRCAARIALERLSAGEIAEVAGCLPASMTACTAWAGQAGALLDADDAGAESGYVAVAAAYEHLALLDDAEAASRIAAGAVAVGRRHRDGEVLALGSMLRGRAAIRMHALADATTALDEAVLLAARNDVPAVIAGLVLTAAVDASIEAHDLDRFDAWTQALHDWINRQRGALAFRSRSLLHQARWHRLHGRWSEALAASAAAGEAPIARCDPAAAAAASHERGEVLRLLGDVAAAEVAYRTASRCGHDPQPGLALLRLSGGDARGAVASLTRSLAERANPLRRIELLPPLVDCQLATGDTHAAAETAAELERLAERHPAAALEAAADHTAATVLLAQGEVTAALLAARRARRVWRHFDLPHDEARETVLIGRCCRLLDDTTTARLEFEAACETFRRLGARPDLLRTRALLDEGTTSGGVGLTSREAEVLRLLATGLTNRAIAARLHVTTRTVDTHVSRILTKLNVPTRTAATAAAHRLELL